MTSLDDGWERAINGQADSVATDIGLALKLQKRSTEHQPVSRTYRRAVELGRRAGESLRWRIDVNAELEYHGDFLNLVAHQLERNGSQYVDVNLPSTVFASRYGS